MPKDTVLDDAEEIAWLLRQSQAGKFDRRVLLDIEARSERIAMWAKRKMLLSDA